MNLPFLLGKCSGQPVPEEGNIFSKIAKTIPFMFNLIRKNDKEQDVSAEKSNLPPDLTLPLPMNGPDFSNVQNTIPVNATSDAHNMQNESIKLDDNYVAGCG